MNRELVIAIWIAVAISAAVLASQHIAGLGSFLIGGAVIAAAAALYFMPAIVASNRRHRSRGSILVINLFLGWTLLFWVVTLAMACGPNVEP